jgi:hypothetical protein
LATIWCALFQSSLPAYQSAANAGKSPSGGFLLARLSLKSDGVIIAFGRENRSYLLIVAAPAKHTISS